MVQDINILEKRVASLFIVSKLKKTRGMWVHVSSPREET